MIELTLKFKDPKVDGLPKESCYCLVFTDTSRFQEVMFSKIHGLFNCGDLLNKKDAEIIAIKNVVYYAETCSLNNETLAKMEETADKAWRKRNGYEEERK